ncbi:hypothetical protein GCM10007972_06000 [Iodidimonas muriae]|uniref:DUF2946 domain-containing protein n=2 Tax=Iodidimonas TaxID=2066486 RepID=A0ABQ2LA13_9PROT|nr:hypothetical protein [Iodidimonas muriae]GGO07061.1 hypothetical protein GCM10007972_06000 [Iodidimonas muriae]
MTMRDCHTYQGALPIPRWGLWLLLSGLLLRALIPVGFMIDMSWAQSDGPLIVLCPDGLEGLVEGTPFEGVFDEHQHHAQADGTQSDMTHRDAAPCVFAVIAALAAAMILLGCLLSLWTMARSWAWPKDIRLDNMAALGNFDARAPPAYA